MATALLCADIDGIWTAETSSCDTEDACIFPGDYWTAGTGCQTSEAKCDDFVDYAWYEGKCTKE